MRLAAAALVLAGLFPAAADAQGTRDGVRDAPLDAVRAVEALPAALGAYRRTGPVTDYERGSGNGLGASVRYVPANGDRARATVYVYDRGQRRRPEGGASPDVAQELRAVSGEIDAMVQAGRYRSASAEGGTGVGRVSEPGSARCTGFRVLQEDGAPTGDSACVAVQDGRFVKVRVTTWAQPDPDAASGIAAALIQDVLRAQGGAPGGAQGGGTATRPKSRP